MKPLFKHQERFLTKDPNHALLLWETQTGKTRAACEWLKLRPDLPALVVCPKGIKEKWQRELAEWGAVATVMTRDEIKRADISQYKAIILDEAQDFASFMFGTNTISQRTAVIYNHLQRFPDTHVLLLTATPIRSTVWNYHTLASFIGHYEPWQDFRKEFFNLTYRFNRHFYEPKPNWRIAIRPRLEAIADIVLARDCADIPPQREHVVEIEWGKDREAAFKRAQKYEEPAAEWHARHRAEQGPAKLSKLKDMIDGYRKVIVICYYTDQINEYAAAIEKEGRQVFVLQGATKDQDAVIEAAKAADDCVFLCQASMSAGFSAAQFSVMIFASMSFKFTDHVQSLGRIKSLTNLHPNDYFYLIAGKNDRAVYERVMAGHDFSPPSYMTKEYLEKKPRHD